MEEWQFHACDLIENFANPNGHYARLRRCANLVCAFDWKDVYEELKKQLTEVEFHTDYSDVLKTYLQFLLLKTMYHRRSEPFALLPSFRVDMAWRIHVMMPAHYTAVCVSLLLMFGVPTETEPFEYDARSTRFLLRSRRYSLCRNLLRHNFGIRRDDAAFYRIWPIHESAKRTRATPTTRDSEPLSFGSVQVTGPGICNSFTLEFDDFDHTSLHDVTNMVAMNLFARGITSNDLLTCGNDQKPLAQQLTLKQNNIKDGDVLIFRFKQSGSRAGPVPDKNGAATIT